MASSIPNIRGVNPTTDTSSCESLAASLSEKIDELNRRWRYEKERNRKLWEQNLQLEERVGQLERAVSEAEDKYRRFRVADALTGLSGAEDGDAQRTEADGIARREARLEARRRIANIVRQIDKCLAALNQ